MAQSSGNHISLMKLFYALKQFYPDVPDRHIAFCIKKAGGDKDACKALLESSEFAPYRIRRPNNNSIPEDKSTKDEGAVGYSPTPCSITRRVPQTLPRPQIPPPSFLHVNSGLSVLIEAQLQRKKNLELEMEKNEKTLEDMRKKWDELNLLLRTNTTSLKIKLLNEEISALREDCIKLFSELDANESNSSRARKPISVQTELIANELDANESNGTRGRRPISVRTELIANGGERISLGTEEWRCEMCTFRNHPLINQCETCMMPRITLGIKAA